MNVKMKKLLCSCLMTVTALTSLCGCALQYETGRERIAEPVTAAPPENGWTSEELAAVCSINYIPLSFPMTLRDFGMDYSFAPYIYGFNMNDPDNPDALPQGHLEGPENFDAFVQFPRGTTEENLNADTPIISFSVYHGISLPDEEGIAPAEVYLNGITFGANEQEITAALGEPDYRREITDSAGTPLRVDLQYDNRDTGNGLLSLGLKEVRDDGGELVLYYICLDFNGENNWKDSRN